MDQKSGICVHNSVVHICFFFFLHLTFNYWIQYCIVFETEHLESGRVKTEATHPNPKTGSGKGTQLNLNLIPMTGTLYLFPYIYLISIPAKIEVKVKLAS